MIDLGYENTNPLMNLGSLFMTVLIYGIGFLSFFVIFLPLKLIGKSNGRYEYMSNLLFFNGFIDIFFNAYFAFVLVSLILINSNESDEQYHPKTKMFSWIMFITCVFLVPIIVLYAALQPQKVR